MQCGTIFGRYILFAAVTFLLWPVSLQMRINPYVCFRTIQSKCFIIFEESGACGVYTHE